MPSPKLEPFLSDQRVGPVAERLIEEFPVLVEYNTDFATAIIEPPWHGILPEGNTAWTTHEVVQFFIVSDHPRPIQKRQGARHMTSATIWPAAFELADKDRAHFVTGSDRLSPEETIFRGILTKHLADMESLKSIISDAIYDPSKPKSALEAL